MSVEEGPKARNYECCGAWFGMDHDSLPFLSLDCRPFSLQGAKCHGFMQNEEEQVFATIHW